jgi:hypothetical protein
MICYEEPGLTEDLYIVQKEELSITCYMRNMYLKRPSIFTRETHPLIRENVTQGLDSKGSASVAG